MLSYMQMSYWYTLLRSTLTNYTVSPDEISPAYLSYTNMYNKLNLLHFLSYIVSDLIYIFYQHDIRSLIKNIINESDAGCKGI
jgi:hypothetical protein